MQSKHILSIQSHVAYGYVGNRAAVFPLQRLGYDVTAVNTTQFSNHTGYDEYEGDIFDHDHIKRILAGVKKQRRLSDYDAILTGYMGDSSLGEIVVDVVREAKADNSDVLYCCDPVMGDIDTGIYVRENLINFFCEQAVRLADIITPNQFELGVLTETKIKTLADVVHACRMLHQQGPKIVLVTSIMTTEMREGEIAMLVSNGLASWMVRTPKLPLAAKVSGAGDATAALFLAKYLEHRNAPKALHYTASVIYDIFADTYHRGETELQMIRSQASLTDPVYIYHIEAVDVIS